MRVAQTIKLMTFSCIKQVLRKYTKKAQVHTSSIVPAICSVMSSAETSSVMNDNRTEVVNKGRGIFNLKTREFDLLQNLGTIKLYSYDT